MELNLETAVETLDAVPEQFRTFYKESEAGGFELAEAYRPAAQVIVGLNTALKAARREAKGRTGAAPSVPAGGAGQFDLGPLSEFGSSAEEIAEKLRDLQARAENSGKRDESAAKRVRDELSRAYEAEKQSMAARLAAREAQLIDTMVSSRAAAALSELGARAAAAELLMPFVKNSIRARESDGGALSVEVVDAQGEVRYGLDGAPMGVRDLVAEMKKNEKYAFLFESEAKSGGGISPRTMAPAARDTANLTPAQKIALGAAKLRRG
jgi:hypothetical protein